MLQIVILLIRPRLQVQPLLRACDGRGIMVSNSLDTKLHILQAFYDIPWLHMLKSTRPCRVIKSCFYWLHADRECVATSVNLLDVKKLMIPSQQV